MPADDERDDDAPAFRCTVATRRPFVAPSVRTRSDRRARRGHDGGRGAALGARRFGVSPWSPDSSAPRCRSASWRWPAASSARSSRSRSSRRCPCGPSPISSRSRAASSASRSAVARRSCRLAGRHTTAGSHDRLWRHVPRRRLPRHRRRTWCKPRRTCRPRSPDGRSVPATVVGSDAWTAVAVVKIDAGQVPVATFGSATGLQIGQTAIAIGAPEGTSGSPSVTVGVVRRARQASRQRRRRAPARHDRDRCRGSRRLIGGALSDGNGVLIGLVTTVAQPDGAEPRLRRADRRRALRRRGHHHDRLRSAHVARRRGHRRRRRRTRDEGRG